MCVCEYVCFVCVCVCVVSDLIIDLHLIGIKKELVGLYVTLYEISLKDEITPQKNI